MSKWIVALALLAMGVFLVRAFQGAFSPVSDNLGWWFLYWGTSGALGGWFGWAVVGPWMVARGRRDR